MVSGKAPLFLQINSTNRLTYYAHVRHCVVLFIYWPIVQFVLACAPSGSVKGFLAYAWRKSLFDAKVREFPWYQRVLRFTLNTFHGPKLHLNEPHNFSEFCSKIL